MKNNVCVCQREKEKKKGQGIKESGLMSPAVWESDVDMKSFFFFSGLVLSRMMLTPPFDNILFRAGWIHT